MFDPVAARGVADEAVEDDDAAGAEVEREAGVEAADPLIRRDQLFDRGLIAQHIGLREIRGERRAGQGDEREQRRRHHRPADQRLTPPHRRDRAA